MFSEAEFGLSHHEESKEFTRLGKDLGGGRCVDREKGGRSWLVKCSSLQNSNVLNITNKWMEMGEEIKMLPVYLPPAPVRC